ncbi:hypothetical protein [Chryseobacterium gossypii]|uniref:hypothetical protein n=1 Tax=Chryseobacterium gossypii TaxID=3231602 RepID=UPI0035267FE2
MIQNSVVGAVGSIFNGIANGQNIFKSALIGFSGINYSFNLSGNSVTSTDISDSPYGGYKTNSEDYSFVSASYAINDEEPVNFFGQTGADAPFYQKYKEMYSFFKGTAGDGVFRAYGHGGYGSIWNGEDEIKHADKFDSVMNARNSNWKNVDKMKDPILILYVCRSATSYPELKRYQPFGQKVSIAHPNLTVIAFDEYVTYDNSIKGIRNINRNENKGDGLGSIVFYRNGEILNRQSYSEFLKKYPKFQ